MVRRVRLNNFRNYGEETVAFEPGINIIIGENGVGKTNMLEAVFILIEGRSMRTSDIREVIRTGEERAYIGGWFGERTEREARAEIEREGGLQRKAVEGIAAVSYTPDDVYMVKGSPEERRRYLDETAGRVRKGYREVAREYGKVLRQRNEAIRMVRRGLWGRESIRHWNPLLLERGAEITSERAQVVRKAEEMANRSGEKWGAERIEIRYYSNLYRREAEGREDEERLLKVEDAEIRRGVTLIGPHRDEMLISYGGRNARRECSHGEQKIVSLLLRIAQAGIMEEFTGEKPLLLFDDCLSELDRKNRSALLELLAGWEQAIITDTDDIGGAQGINRVYL